MHPASDHAPLRLVALGGLGEFGLNALVLEWDEHCLLLDAGALFGTAELPGVDSVVPDFRYLAERRERLRGIVLTHGHEDHIGGLAFALQAAPAPVFGSALTLGFVRRRLRDRGLEADLRLLTPPQDVEVGPFRVFPIRVAHSVIDSLALAVETPAGVVLASGDFKIGSGGAADETTDVDALSRWGDRGVDVLLSDSTNVETRGRTGAEDDLLPAFEEVFARTRGRVLVSCFATSVPRIQRVARTALAAGRSLAFIGRRMADNAEVATELGLLDVPPGRVLPASAVRDYPAGGLCLFVSGSQGEPFSALSMMSVDEHRDLAVGPGDTVVLSSRPIPGNERAVSRLIGNLFRRGCDVVHGGTARVHVSGHASQDELAEMIQRVRPRHFVPVHGEYRMLAQHARLAVQAGVPADRVFILEDGDVLALAGGAATRAPSVAAGRILLDRSGVDEVEEVVVRDRRHLSSEGIVVPVLVLDRQTGRIESPPELVTRGFVDWEEWPGLMDDATRLVAEVVEERPPEEHYDPALTRERVRQELRRLFRKRTQRRPMVIPVVMEV
ncbi:MAG TPA: ribonuclease J [Vicinamibacteria bacterium]|nr:ribonuclease J [Vicinamibacteria bacterium]